MDKRQRLTLQQVLNEIFMDPLCGDHIEDHLEEHYSDSDKCLPESEVPNEVTATCNEPIPSTSNQKCRLSLKRLCRTSC